MNLLALEDMAGKTEAEIKAHIADEYAGTESGFSYGEPTDDEKKELAERLAAYDILIAYESVGNWGCDSSSWFLLRHKEKGTLHTISGSHCSCFGFEGQGEIEETSIEYLNSKHFYLPTGGYDESEKENTNQVVRYIAQLAVLDKPDPLGR